MFDELISDYEIRAHQPYNLTHFGNNDKFRIATQDQNLNLLPSKSTLHISRKLTQTNGDATVNTRFVNNAVCHLFEEIRYEINSNDIDQCENGGLTTLMKGYTWCSYSQKVVLENADWVVNEMVGAAFLMSSRFLFFYTTF